MKKTWIWFAVILTLIILNKGILCDTASAQHPDFQRHDKILSAAEINDYHGGYLKDYKYMGRKQTNGDRISDLYRFKTVKNGKQVRVTLTATYDLKKEKLLDLSIREEALQ